MAGLELQNVRVWLGGQEILKGVDLSVAEGECVALLGPSGCGKTTTLRVIAGFTQAQQGSVRIAGQAMHGTPPYKRNVGLVFQDYALFPHMTIAENVAYGLQMRRLPKPQIAKRVADALAMVQLAHVGERFPANLSGGQRQRVALARALVIQPDILLLDEPLGALDRKLRDQMQVELKQLQRRLGITTIIVTHDQEEALSLADRVAVMFNGNIREIGAPAQLYEKPGSREVMEFLGSSNILPGRITARDGRGGDVELAAGLRLQLPLPLPASSDAIILGIRPEHVELAADSQADGALAAELVECVYKGSLVEVHTRLKDGGAFQINASAIQVAQHQLGQRGAMIGIRLPAQHIQIFAA